MKNSCQACLHALLIAFFLLPASLSVTSSIPVMAEATDASASSILEPGAVYPGISVSKTTLKQGETFKVSVGVQTTAGGSTENMTVKFDECKAKLFLESRNDTLSVYSALLAVPAQLKPGKYAITVHGITGVVPANTTVTVHDAHFPVQKMTLPKEKDNFKASPGEKEAMAAAKLTVTDEQMWKGKLKSPVPGAPLSSRFGRKRIVNGRLLSDYFHSGLDFRAARGTAIHATASGKVIIAKTGWRLHGNTVVIDHGHGILSIYIHMNRIDVKVGDEVQAGQTIGAVGSTGRASGPHLHFCIYVNGTASNPEGWLAKKF